MGGWPGAAAPWASPCGSRCARPRPPYADAKGDGVDSCLRKWGKAGSPPPRLPGMTGFLRRCAGMDGVGGVGWLCWAVASAGLEVFGGSG